MTLFDYVVLVIVGASVVISVTRGFVREVIALAGWIGAFVAATTFSATVSGWLANSIEEELLRTVSAFLIVFFPALLAAALIAIASSKLLRTAGMGVEDRLLGGLFGLARGMLIIMVLVLLAGLTGLPRQPAWMNAMLSPPLEAMAGAMKAWLPPDLSRFISYD
jgi:membrane protein required for colicin V production